MGRLPNRDRAARNVEMMEFIRGGATLTEAAEKFDLSPSAVCRCAAKNGLRIERRTVVVNSNASATADRPPSAVTKESSDG
jgi:hypothetical protein